MARPLILAVFDAWLEAMIECTCRTHLPVCMLNPDGSQCMLQPFAYGGV